MVPKNRAGRFLEVTFSGPSGRIQRDGKHWSIRKTVSWALLVYRAPDLYPTRMLKVRSRSQAGRGLSLCMAAFHQSLSSVPSHFLSGAQEQQPPPGHSDGSRLYLSAAKEEPPLPALSCFPQMFKDPEP